jgi:hypothetical protein
MIFRQANGSLVEINKLSFITDKQYYKKIVSLKNALYFPKDEEKKTEIKEINNKYSYSRECIQRLL